MERTTRTSKRAAALILGTASVLFACSPSPGSSHQQPEPPTPEATGGEDPGGGGGSGGMDDSPSPSGSGGSLGGAAGAAATATGGSSAEEGSGGGGDEVPEPEPEPEPEPVCCGCLCLDSTWSCSDDTCVDAEGRAVGLRAEAGFFELPGEDYVSESQLRKSPTHRVWYMFHPADEAPADKPLAVFFNGGPGSSTTVLFGFNTSPWTLDPEVTGAEDIAVSASRWTQFANTLHVDAPATGFSYALPATDGSTPSVGIDLDHDASIFLRVVLRFLARHPALQQGPVLLVGQSYGGTRATLMLEHALHYQRLASDDAAYQNPELHAEFVQHFAVLFPDQDPETVSPNQVATQFSHQVLIQPVVAGSMQWNLNDPDRSACRPPPYSDYQCDEPSAWFDDQIALAAQRLTTPTIFEQAIGVDPTTIAWMHASQRSNAYGKTHGEVTPTTELEELFGTLGSQDNYYITFNEAVFGYYPSSRNWRDPYIGYSFLDNVYYVRTFITDARMDMVVWTPAIPPALSAYTNWVESSLHDQEDRPGVARPGWIALNYLESAFPEPTAREIRFPHYATAGHAVSMRQPAELLEDVMDWYAAPAAAPLFLSSGRAVSKRPAPDVLPRIPHRPGSDYLGP